MIRVTPTAPVQLAKQQLRRSADRNRLVLAWAARYTGLLRRDQTGR